jgi:O-antigen/teichoic acid export membrane protein
MLQGVKNTAKSSIIYGLGNISTKLIGIILMPLFTDTGILTIEDYGVLGVVDVTIQVLVALIGLSLYQAFFRWYWDSKYIDQRKSLFFTILSFLLLLGGLSMIFAYAFSLELSQLMFASENYSRVIFLMILSVVLQIITQLPLSLMRLEEKPILYTITNISRLVITLGLTIIFITTMDRGLEGIYEAQVLGSIAFLIITSVYIFNRLACRFEFRILKEMLDYSLPLTIASVSGILLATLDRYVLNYRATLLDVGIYTTAFRFANTVRVFIVHSLQLAVAPAIFKLMNHPNNKEIYARIMTYFAVLVIYASLALSIFGAEILELFVTDRVYHKALFVIPIICLGILLSIVKDVAMNGLNIVKKTKIVSVIVPLIAIFHLGLTYIVVPIYGVFGAAWASAFSQSVFFIIVLHFAQKYYPIPYEYKRILASFFIAFPLLLIGINITQFSSIINILLKILILVLFPLVLWLTPFLKEDEKSWVYGGYRKFLKLFDR